MLRLKMLTGPLAGQSMTLKDGDNLVGRGPQCDVIILSQGVSKQHAKLTVQGDQCVAQDLNSSNGTFVNGTKIKNRILRPGDRIGFHDVVVELMRATLGGGRSIPNIPAQTSAPMTPQVPSSTQQSWSAGSVAYDQNFGQNLGQNLGHNPGHNPGQQISLQGQAYGQQPGVNPVGLAQPIGVSAPEGLADVVKSYIENVVLPGVYRLTEMYPLKFVMGFFVGLFALMVTALATIPMAQLTKDGVQKEAERRAITLARQVAGVAEKSITGGGEGFVRVDFAMNEEGVQEVLVISAEDGHIIAPITKAQSYPTDEFTTAARHEQEEYVRKINSSTIGVSVPVRGFSSEAGRSIITSYAIIIYKMDTLNWSATVGLFARVLVIAAILGALIYFFLYKIVANPVIETIGQIDQVLRGERDMVNTKVDFDIFKTLIDNINSVIGRMSQAGPDQNAITVDYYREAGNLVRIVSDAAFALDNNGLFIAVNVAFQDLTAMRLETVQGQSLDVLQDQALRLNLLDLIQQGRARAGEIVTANLEISGLEHEIDVQVSPDPREPGSAAFIFGTIKKRSGS